jgi:hypothetical protein
MEKNKVICTRINPDTMARIKKHDTYTTVSGFINKAIMNELNKNNNFTKSLTNVGEKGEELTTVVIKKKVSDLEVKLHIVFDEIRKQNQLLTLIHSRSSQSSELVKLIVDNQFDISIGDEIIDEVATKTKAEIKNIGLVK